MDKCEEDIRTALKPVQLKEFRYQPHRIDIGPAPKKDPQPSKTAQAAAAAAAAAEAPVAGGATDPPRSGSASSLTSSKNGKLAVPSSGRAALTSSQGEEDDFESPFHELSAELSEKQKHTSGDSENEPAPPMARHRKTLSMGALTFPTQSQDALQSSGGLSALDAAANKRRLRRRGSRRGSSGNHKVAIALALGGGDSSAEPSPRDPLTTSQSSESLVSLPAALGLSSSTDQMMTPSITERKYLQRKRSVDRSRPKHGKSNSTENDEANAKRRLFARPSRENLGYKTSRRSNEHVVWRFVLILFSLFFCVIMAVGLLSQYSCEYWGLYCT